LYKRNQMSAGDIDTLLELWGASLLASESGAAPLFASHEDLYKTIDNAKVGDVLWSNFTVRYDGEVPVEPPSWMVKDFNVWYQNEPFTLYHVFLPHP
jgi:Plavaka transposase